MSDENSSLTPPARRRRRPRSILFKMAAALGGLVLALALAEIGLRVWYASPQKQLTYFRLGGNHPRYMFIADPQTGYRLRPYFEGRLIQPQGDFDVPVAINSLGLRDNHLSPADAPFPRILGLGDSITFGEGVEPDQTYLARLEEIYRKVYGQEITVIDAGVPGYSIDQARRLLPRLFPEFKPQLVTIAWSPANHYRELGPFKYSHGFIHLPVFNDMIVERGDLVLVSEFKKPGLRRADLWAQTHSFLYNFLKYNVGYALIESALWGGSKKSRITPEVLKPAVANLAALRQICLDQGVNFLIIYVAPPDDETAKLFITLCHEENLPLFLLTAVPDPKRNPDLLKGLNFEHDGHPTAKFHELIAKELAVFLTQHPELLLHTPHAPAPLPPEPKP